MLELIFEMLVLILTLSQKRRFIYKYNLIQVDYELVKTTVHYSWPNYEILNPTLNGHF